MGTTIKHSHQWWGLIKLSKQINQGVKTDKQGLQLHTLTNNYVGVGNSKGLLTSQKIKQTSS